MVEECPLTALYGGQRRLHEAGSDAVERLSKQSMKLWTNEQQQQLDLVSLGARRRTSRAYWCASASADMGELEVHHIDIV